MAELVAACGILRTQSRGGGHSLPREEIQLSLVYPANKDPVVERHCAAYGIRGKRIDAPYARRDRPSSYPRSLWFFRAYQAIKLCESLGWSCGNDRKDRQMQLWRMWRERRLPRWTW